MPCKTTQLQIRSGGLLSAQAGGKLIYFCALCRPAERRAKIAADGYLDAIDTWRQHILDEHADLLTPADHRRLGETVQLAQDVWWVSHRTDCRLVLEHAEACTCGPPPDGPR
jgi:hypothetical protein